MSPSIAPCGRAHTLGGDDPLMVYKSRWAPDEKIRIVLDTPTETFARANLQRKKAKG
jgi:hypothetical protein